MAPREMSDFLWNNAPLPPCKKKLSTCQTDEDITVYLINYIRTCEVNEAREIIDEHESNTNIPRLFERKIIWKDGEKSYTDISFNRPHRVTALAYYIFAPKPLTQECENCKSKKAKGPGKDCLSLGRRIFKGACFNCFYSGLGAQCSLRLDIEKKDREEEIERKGGKKWATEDQLELETVKELEKREAQLAAVLRRREKAVYKAQTPKKNRSYDVLIDDDE